MVNTPSPMEQLQGVFGKWFGPTSTTISKKASPSARSKVDLTIYDADIAAAKEILLVAAATKSTKSEDVIESLLSLEKLMRSKNKLDEGATSLETLECLNGGKI